jgi:periplasmic copper chaperone A
MRRVFPALLLAAFSMLASAGDDIRVEDAWVREAPPTARMLAAYMTISNDGDREQTLVGVESPQFNHVMLHKSEVIDGVARMLHQDSIAVPAHGSVRLEPGGLHLMMPAPKAPLKAGDRVEFVLEFAGGQRARIEAEVRKKP